MFNYPIGKGGMPPKKMAKSPVHAGAEHAVEEHGGGDEVDTSDKPVMTNHNDDGTHTTVHESGMEHDHANLDELKKHLDKFFTEEQHEGEGEGEY